jgi:protein-L-isoaspartate(D-aspartate) O-methyltransferase
MNKKELLGYLVDRQYITSKEVLRAFEKVPREDFVEKDYKKHAYDDIPLPIRGGQTISQPSMVVMMLEHLSLKPSHKVLEIGTGLGYFAALMSKICKKGLVYTIEYDKDLAKEAEKRLKDYKNVIVIQGDGSLGYESAAPYDRIVASCACRAIPEPWIKQLKSRGLLLAPLGSRHLQTLHFLRKSGAGVSLEEIPYSACAFVPLVGKHGF